MKKKILTEDISVKGLMKETGSLEETTRYVCSCESLRLRAFVYVCVLFIYESLTE